MALDKSDILIKMNSLLADFSAIVPSEHRETMEDIIDKAYDENIDGVELNTDGYTLNFYRNGAIDNTLDVDLSGLSGSGGFPEGTDVKSTGETAGKVLTAEGDGTSYWSTPAGGGDMTAAVYDPANKSEQVLTISDASDYATAAQGTLADSAIQSGDLSDVSTSGDYSDLLNTPDTITTQQASDITANNAKVSYTDAALVATHTTDISTLDSDKLDSVTTGEPTGSDALGNAVSLTQAEYDAGTPVATTFYVIT